jgi:hypothetical protein
MSINGTRQDKAQNISLLPGLIKRVSKRTGVLLMVATCQYNNQNLYK